MNWQSISPILRIGLLLGAVCYLALILWLLKKKKLTVRYSIIWLISAGVRSFSQYFLMSFWC